MTVNLTTLSTRIGKGGYLLHLVNEFRGAAGLAAIATDLPTEWEDFVEQYDSASDAIRACVSSMVDALAQARSGLSGMQNSIADAIQATIIEMVDSDAPLTTTSIDAALDELIAQMTDSADSIQKNAVTVTATLGDMRTNTGDGVCVVYAKDDMGQPLQYSYPEKLRCNVTSNATAGEEVWIVEGEAAVDLLDWPWPGGSGSSETLTSINASGTGNLLTNSDFEAFTVANTPDDWSIETGTVGVHIFSIGTIYAGSTALKLTSDGATGASISQVVSGLSVRTPYAFSAWVRVNSATAAGSTTIQLWDLDNGVPLEDEAGNQIVLTIPNSGLTTLYTNYSLAFTIKDPLPVLGVEVRVAISTTTTSGRSVYIDHLSLGELTRMYYDGPAVGFFSGAINWILDDNAKVDVTNDLAGKLQTVLWRTCDLVSLQKKIPSSGSPTVSDSAVS